MWEESVEDISLTIPFDKSNSKKALISVTGRKLCVGLKDNPTLYLCGELAGDVEDVQWYFGDGTVTVLIEKKNPGLWTTPWQGTPEMSFDTSEEPDGVLESPRSWAKGVQAWFAALRGDTPDPDLLSTAMQCFEKAMANDCAMQDDLRARRALFLGVCRADSGERAEAFAHLSVARRLGDERTRWAATIEACLLSEECGDIDAARTLGAHAVRDRTWASPWQRPRTLLPSLASRPFWDPRQFPWVSQLEANSDVIREEFLQLRPQAEWPLVGGDHRDSGRHDADVLARGSWTELVVFGSGGEPEKVPQLAGIVRDLLPSAVELCERGLGEVILSALTGGTRIASHCAPTNVRLTAHLGIVVPSEAEGTCALRVGEEWRRWQEGRVLVFDDSWEHEVVNDTERDRVVLLLRFWHPDVPERGRAGAMQQIHDDSAFLHKLRVVPPLRAEHAPLERRLRGEGQCGGCGENRDVVVEGGGVLGGHGRDSVWAVCVACGHAEGGALGG